MGVVEDIEVRSSKGDIDGICHEPFAKTCNDSVVRDLGELSEVSSKPQASGKRSWQAQDYLCIVHMAKRAAKDRGIKLPHTFLAETARCSFNFRLEATGTNI